MAQLTSNTIKRFHSRGDESIPEELTSQDIFLQ